MLSFSWIKWKLCDSYIVKSVVRKEIKGWSQKCFEFAESPLGRIKRSDFWNFSNRKWHCKGAEEQYAKLQDLSTGAEASRRKDISN